MAWAVVEDIGLTRASTIAGRLVAETTVRRIWTTLGLNKDTVTQRAAH